MSSRLEAGDVAAYCLEEAITAADIYIGAAEVVRGDIEKLAIAACCRDQLAII